MRLDIGPYPLDWDIIDQAIIRRSSGVIVLGAMASNRRTFQARAVASAASDLKRTLFALADEADHGWFRCAYSKSAAEAVAWANGLRHDLLSDSVGSRWHDGRASCDDQRFFYSPRSNGVSARR